MKLFGGAHAAKRHTIRKRRGVPRSLVVVSLATSLLFVRADSTTAAFAATTASAPKSDLERIIAWVEANAASTFGGLWEDPAGVTVTTFTKNVDTARANLQQVVMNRGNLKVVAVERSLQELYELQRRIDVDTAALTQSGAVITGTGILPDRNLVQVRVQSLTPAVSELLTARYGDAVHIIEGDYVRPAHKNPGLFPWTGGMHTSGVCTGSADCLIADCTSNFVVYQFTHGVKFFYLLTAGHCFDYGTKVSVHGVTIGTVVQQVWGIPGENADVEKILFDQPLNSWPYTFTTGLTEEVLTSVAPSQVLGQSVCKSGISTDETCGWTVSAVHATVTICTDPSCTFFVTLTDQVEAMRASPGIAAGDSGGPVYRRTSDGLQGHGIISAMNASRTVMTYSFLPNALNRTSTYLCTLATC